jgi:hypothetical protein
LVAKRRHFPVQRTVALVDAIFNFGVFVVAADEIALLPFVGFLADVEKLRCDDMPPLRATAVALVAVEEFCFGPEMVLSQRLGIGDE